MDTALPFSYDDVIRRRAQQISVPLTPDIYQWYQEMQRSHAVWFDPQRASWLVFRYEDVLRIVLETQTFSSQRVVDANGKVDPIVGSGILGMDPPRHRYIRALVSQAFTPRRVATLEPFMIAIVRSLLDKGAGKEEMDLIDDLAFPLPMMVITELLGVSNSDRELFRAWSADYVGTNYNQRIAASHNIADYFRRMMIQRRHDPQDDLMTALIRAEIDGEHLPEEDILGTYLLLLIAGHETTVGLIGNAFASLDEHPESLRQVIEQPALLSSAIEEALRYRSPVHELARVVMRDTILGGQEIKAGELVLPLFPSANLDERQFPHADTFDIRRSPNHHLGFGHGIHFCLGAPLARLEVRIALEMLFERFPSIRRKRDVALVPKLSYFIYSFAHMPIEW